MFNIGGLFQKFINLQAREVGIRKNISDSIKKNTGIFVDVNNIEINNNIIFIKKLPQAGKNVLFMKKDLVLEEINSIKDQKPILNIRF